jgi:hypothetical protein
MFKFYYLIFSIFIVFSCSKDDKSSDEELLSQDNEDVVFALKVHNDARKEVGVNILEWSDELSKDAKAYAEILAKNNKGLIHSENSDREGQGENLSLAWNSSGEIEKPLNDGSVAWYNEIKDYKYAEIGSSLNEGVVIGHYTQMIWYSTKYLGMGSAISTDGKVYVVARYNPPGNYIGEYPY